MTNEQLWIENRALRELLKQKQAINEVQEQEVWLLRDLAIDFVNNSGKLDIDSIKLLQRVAHEFQAKTGRTTAS